VGAWYPISAKKHRGGRKKGEKRGGVMQGEKTKKEGGRTAKKSSNRAGKKGRRRACKWHWPHEGNVEMRRRPKKKDKGEQWEGKVGNKKSTGRVTDGWKGLTRNGDHDDGQEKGVKG